MQTKHPVVDRALSALRVDPPHAIGIHGKLYDVDAFAARHPGGVTLLRAAQGTDATALFVSSHVDASRARATLERLPVLGTYSEPDASKASRFDTYAHVRETVVFPLFPTRASRDPPALSTLVSWAVLGLTLAAHWMLLKKETCWSTVMMSALCNTICGGLGHNALHRMRPWALLLDWNGLSCYEWVLEHVVSHHPHVNTEQDHDALSMEPFLRWLPHRPAALWGDARDETWGTHFVYAIGEIVVALQGFVGHRARWYAPVDAPRWVRFAPWIFVARVLSHVWVQGVWNGIVSLIATMAVASYLFSYLAHLNHRPHVSCNGDFALAQLANTCDVSWAFTLYLDRQRAHHLFPTIDHARLTPRVRRLMEVAAFQAGRVAKASVS